MSNRLMTTTCADGTAGKAARGFAKAGAGVTTWQASCTPSTTQACINAARRSRHARQVAEYAPHQAPRSRRDARVGAGPVADAGRATP